MILCRFHRNNNDVVREVSSGGRYSINRSGLRQRLQIQRPTSEDEGEYYITAQNCAGVIDSDDRGTFVNVYMAPMILIDPPLTPAIGSCQSNPGFDVISVRNVDSYEVSQLIHTSTIASTKYLIFFIISVGSTECARMLTVSK